MARDSVLGLAELIHMPSEKLRCWLKFGLLAFFVFAVVIAAALWSLKIVASRNGVREVALPRSSLITRFENGADYVDAYELKLRPNAIKNISAVIDSAFAKFTEVERTDTEVLYTDRSPGLTFYVLYRLDSVASPTTLTMATVVHYTSLKGRLYFALVRPFHRALVPFMFSRMLTINNG